MSLDLEAGLLRVIPTHPHVAMRHVPSMPSRHRRLLEEGGVGLWTLLYQVNIRRVDTELLRLRLK